MAGQRATPMRITMVPPTRATASQSTAWASGAAGSSWPVTTVNDVDGVAHGDGDAGVRGHRRCADVMPGTTSNGTPASSRAAASSPPRANTNGSPPLRRTTAGRPAAVDEQPLDVLLRQGDVAGCLADVDALGRRRRQVEQARHRQPVVDDHVGRGEHLGGTHGEQPGITGSGADEEHGHRRSLLQCARAANRPSASSASATSLRTTSPAGSSSSMAPTPCPAG